MKARLAAFCSHGGSNFAAIADAASRGEIPIEVALMVHNNARAGAKAKAEARGIATAWVPRGGPAGAPGAPDAPGDRGDGGETPADQAYTARLLEALERHGIEFIALAGFMQLVPREVVRRFSGRITNIHPALLPLFGGRGFYGHHVHAAVFAAGMKVSGATVHLVDEEYDRGPILAQRAVSIEDCRTPEEIAARVLVEEHRLYPETLGRLVSGAFRVVGRRVELTGAR